MSIYSYLPNDSYKPPIDKPELGQYDNYQIYDIYCDDIVYEILTINGHDVDPPEPVKFKNFLAVERVSPIGAIECDFNAIANIYR
jgi:hypothetical protein